MPNPPLANIITNPLVICGVAFTLLMSVLGLFSPLIGPLDPLDQQLRLRHQPPLSTGVAVDRTQDPPAERERFFLLGTDHLGRDVLSRVAVSFKFTAHSGLLAWCVGTALAWLLVALRGGPGRVAAASPARWFPLGVFNSSALVLTALILGASHLLMWSYLRVSLLIFQEGPFTINVTLFSWIFAAVVPATLLYHSLRQAASANGSNLPQGRRWGWLMVRHTVWLAPVGLSLAVLTSIFIEYPWSFLGFGTQPPQSSLTLMMSQGRQYLVTAWWVFYIPLMLIFISIGAFLAIALPLRRAQELVLYPVRGGGAAAGQPAPHLERLGAFSIDLLLLWLLKFLVPSLLSFLWSVVFYVTRNSTLLDWLLNPGSQILAYVFIIGYFPFFWALSGQTPGMKIFGLKVTRTDGTPVSLPRAALRLMGLAVGGAILFLGLVWALFDARRQGWHDKIAGTLVVRAETGSGLKS